VGFWQTGYLDQVLDGVDQGKYGPDQVPPLCELCGEVFSSLDQLRDHVFNTHPAGSPELVIAGRLAARQGEVIRSSGLLAGILALDTTRASLNGQDIAPDGLSDAMAKAGNGRHRITLWRDRVMNQYVLELDMADADAVRIVDEMLKEFFASGDLTVGSISTLSGSCSKVKSAKSYLEGMVQYCFGVLAKDQRGDTDLSREDYVERFNLAAYALQGHSTLVARAIRTVIALDQNVFDIAPAALDIPVLARSFDFFRQLTKGEMPEVPEMPFAGQGSGLRFPIDVANENFILLTFHDPAAGDEMAAALERWATGPSLLRNDRPKARILLGYWHLMAGNTELARSVLRGLVNDPVFGFGSRSLLDHGL
jgi:hypothetical protein